MHLPADNPQQVMRRLLRVCEMLRRQRDACAEGERRAMAALDQLSRSQRRCVLCRTALRVPSCHCEVPPSHTTSRLAHHDVSRLLPMHRAGVGNRALVQRHPMLCGCFKVQKSL